MIRAPGLMANQLGLSPGYNVSFNQTNVDEIGALTT
jgi:hypothetical protein